MTGLHVLLAMGTAASQKAHMPVIKAKGDDWGTGAGQRSQHPVRQQRDLTRPYPRDSPLSALRRPGSLQPLTAPREPLGQRVSRVIPQEQGIGSKIY